MGNFTPRDALWIGVALLLLSIPYILLSGVFAPKPDPNGMMPVFIANIGFTTTAFILIILGLLTIFLGLIFNRKKFWE